MPKPMLKQQQVQTQSEVVLKVQQQEKGNSCQQMDKIRLDRLLRQKRSKEYITALHKLDAGGHTCNQRQVDEIISAICAEFPAVEIRDILLGFVAICYLGEPYEVHTLDFSGQIIQHYKVGQPLPGGLEKARTIAIRGGYDFVEVYIDCCRCISSTGTVSVVAG